jgi:hypothetical protein
VDIPSEEPILRIFAYEGRLFATNHIVNAGEIYRSENEGASWSAIGPTVSSYLGAHTYFDGKLCISLYHGGAHGTLWRSIDFGDAWELVGDLPTTYNINGLAVAGPRLVIGASSGSPDNESIWFSEHFAGWAGYTGDLPQAAWPVNDLWSHDGWLFKTGGTVQTYRAPHPELPASLAEGRRPGGAAALLASPNPFRLTTTIEFVLPLPGSVRLDVLDLQGRVIKRLVSRAEEPGSHFVVWDRTDDLGDMVRSGVYFARLQATGLDAQTKLLLIE